MKKKNLFIAAWCVLALFAGDISARDELFPQKSKKLLQFGWDNADAEFLDKNVEMMETYLPYDGVGIKISKTITLPNGKRGDTTYRNFSKMKFKKEWYEKDIAHLQSFHKKAKKLKHNFLGVAASTFTGEFDIFDDAFWEATCHNFALIAHVAKQGGCKGIRFDLEDYSNYQNWRYRAECGKSYAEAWNKARERGRQWMNAIAREYPDITIFCHYWLDLVMGYADGSPQLYERLQGCGSGLLVAFINGIYDVLPPKATIVDGMEAHGYAAKCLDDYQKMRALREVRYAKLLAPENQKKFRERGSLAVGTYLSCYTNSKPPYSFRKFMDAEKMTPLEYFRRNFTYAVEYSDEYVWTWNEHRKWFPIQFDYSWKNKYLLYSPDVPGPYVGMAIPGIEDAMVYAKDPWKYAFGLLKNPSKLKNLLKNPSFEGNGGKIAVGLAPDSVTFKNLPNWETYKNKRSQAVFSLAESKGVNGSNALMIRDGEGVVHQSVKINPNGAYIVRAKAKFAGQSGGSLGIQWRNEKGIWHNHNMVLAAPFNEDQGGGWKRATIIVRSVPAGSRYLSPMLSSSGKKDSFVLFDDVEVFNIFEKEPEVAPHLREAMEQWKKNKLMKQAAAVKNEKKSPSVPGNKVNNGNFQKRREVISDYTLPEGALFKLSCEAYSNKGPRKPRFFCVVGKGAGYADDSAGAVVGGNGCMVFHVSGVKPGQKYRVRAKAKVIGSGTPSLPIFWSSKRVKGPWDHKLGIPKFAFSQKDDKGWLTAEGEITVPKEATKFALIPTVSGLKGEKDRVFFDDLEAVLIP